MYYIKIGISPESRYKDLFKRFYSFIFEMARGLPSIVSPTRFL